MQELLHALRQTEISNDGGDKLEVEMSLEMVVKTRERWKSPYC